MTDSSPSSVAIRVARQEDLPQLQAFEQGIVEVERPLDTTLKDGTIHYYDLAALIVAPDIRVVVAERDGQLVGSGFAQVRPSQVFRRHARHAYLGFMYVVPECRRMGINGAIMEALLAWAREQGVTEIQLEVYANNQPALRAYQKLGFSPDLLRMRIDTSGGKP